VIRGPARIAVDARVLAARHSSLLRPQRGRLLRRALVLAALAVPLALAVHALDIGWLRVLAGLGKLGDLVVLMWPPLPGSAASAALYLRGLAESLAIAFLGTLLAALLAFPVALLAARNVVPNPFVHFTVRRGFDAVRAVDVLIWALLWVSAVGLGPFAGVLAIACSDFGIFGKLFSEALEAGERGPVDGVRATGSARTQAVRWGLLPQVMPVIASQVLYFFESNTRSATIIGIVGAGGIGLHLTELIRTLDWSGTGFVVLLILVAVAVIDRVSARLRFAMIGRGRPARP
jgi:phosphonate transport system permease protein